MWTYLSEQFQRASGTACEHDFVVLPRGVEVLKDELSHTGNRRGRSSACRPLRVRISPHLAQHGCCGSLQLPSRTQRCAAVIQVNIACRIQHTSVSASANGVACTQACYRTQRRYGEHTPRRQIQTLTVSKLRKLIGPDRCKRLRGRVASHHLRRHKANRGHRTDNITCFWRGSLSSQAAPPLRGAGGMGVSRKKISISRPQHKLVS